MEHLPTILAIATGGAIGAVSRWAISTAVHRMVGVLGFPLGTLTVNLLGCIIIGFCYVWFEHRGTTLQRSFVGIGLIGALTTFSTYSIESIDLFLRGSYSYAAFNLIASVMLGVGAAALGIALGKIATTG